ncbi:hypothetical protein VNO77_00375 [Canavalia gladiata]|uniref:Uncharacterized protein n=1 Tax=Canavalia gladiata TaxID=3824 RepID=A0AAN9MUJ7_CANGL
MIKLENPILSGFNYCYKSMVTLLIIFSNINVQNKVGKEKCLASIMGFVLAVTGVYDGEGVIGCAVLTMGDSGDSDEGTPWFGGDSSYGRLAGSGLEFDQWLKDLK